MQNLKLKIFKYLFIFLIFNFSFLIFNLNLVRAQQVSLSISPPLLEVIIKPGKSLMVAYNIKNAGDPVILQARIVNFEPYGNLGQIKLKNSLEGPIRFSLDNSKIQLERPFFLDTGASDQLLLRIRAIDGAPSGDYYYTLLLETDPQNTLLKDSGSQAKAALGSNILITVTDSGLIEIKPKIVMFDIQNKINLFGKKFNIIDSLSKIPIILIIANKGKNLIKPEGSINLYGSFGEKKTYQLIPKNILSESERLIEASPSANYLFQGKPVSLIIDDFLIGYYHLNSQISFGDNSPTLFAKTSFFVFPFKIFLLLIFIIIIIIIIINRFG